MRELHPGRLGLVEIQLLLEVLVHDVDHAVADSPEEEQRTDQDESEGQVGTIVADEEAFLLRAHWAGTILSAEAGGTGAGKEKIVTGGGPAIGGRHRSEVVLIGREPREQRR